MPRPIPLVVAALLALTALSGCSLKSEDSGGDPAERVGSGVSSGDDSAVEALGFPTTATRDTIRVPGEDPAADAAGVASALFPSTTAETRPAAIALVDQDQWQAGVAAAVFSGNPLRAPILLSDGGDLPAVTEDALRRLKPRGQALAEGAQVILVGERPPAPDGVKSGAIKGNDPYEIAAAVDRFQIRAAGKPTPNVLVASGEDPAYAMPAAAYAARSGTPVLFVKKNEVPQPTSQAIQQHSKPNIYVLGPPSVVSPQVEKQLGGLGRVTRIAPEATNPVESAVAFTQFSAKGFGWGPIVPGDRIYTIANASRPLDAAAAAALGSNGVYAPLLVTDQSDALPKPMEQYLLDVQPGFYEDPKDGHY
ncbi:MAG TPA: cell wall-binding repeat-containing protein, partial [Thermoleophilaceae bacterium]|nr:cell wall-binding repeat-containing protein [Thermoleophilaceae bacterium]